MARHVLQIGKEMSNTKEGGIKTRETIFAKYGKDFYKNIGAIGGKVENPKKGFGSNNKLAREAGVKGGTISRRSKK